VGVHPQRVQVGGAGQLQVALEQRDRERIEPVSRRVSGSPQEHGPAVDPDRPALGPFAHLHVAEAETVLDGGRARPLDVDAERRPVQVLGAQPPG
jgi:hypothetical protein